MSRTHEKLMVTGDATYSVTFVHLSDIHWDYPESAAFRSKQMLGDKRASVARNHGIFSSALYRASLKAADSSDKTYLVLGGDNVYKSGWDRKRVTTLKEELLLPAVRLTLDGKPLFHGVIAVPGNHDSFSPRRSAAVSDTETWDEAAPFDKFQHFKALCAELQTSSSVPITFQTPFSQSPITRIFCGAEKSIAVWAINSAENSGLHDAAEEKVRNLLNALRGLSSKIKRRTPAVSSVIQQLAAILESAADDAQDKFYDPGSVDRIAAAECEEALAPWNDTLRIAILHHNNLPTNNDDSEKYRFLNASYFNNFLLRNQFRVVLHGHQHVAEVAAYTKFDSSRPSEYSSYLTDGFLAVGAPAFNFGSHQAEHRGFNVVRLELHSRHDICRVSVASHLWDSPHGDLVEHLRVHDIALSKPADAQRIMALQDVNRIIFSKTSLRGIAHGIDKESYEQNHSESLRNGLAECDNIRAIYALSVFTPTKWLHSKLVEVFEPVGRLNIKRAAGAFSKSRFSLSDGEGLLFQFSMPLLHAVKTAAENIRTITEINLSRLSADLKERRYAQAYDFVRTKCSAVDIGLRSMSVFGQAALRDARKAQVAPELNSAGICDTWIEKGIARPFANFGGVFKKELTQVCKLSEFPRIVLWDKDEFLRPSALDIILFHETMGFPLFWLDTSFLRTPDGASRRQIGYVSVIAPRQGDDVQTVRELFHDDHGKKLYEVSNFVDLAWGGSDVRLWPLKKAKMGLEQRKFRNLGRSDRALHEYIWLLGHPSLTFAADAWCARQSGDKIWRKFRLKLDHALESIRGWAPKRVVGHRRV